MDFDLLVFLLIFLAPLIRRLFGKKQPQRKAPPQPTPPAEIEPGEAEHVRTEPQEIDPLSEALRQIREALGEPVRPEPPPLPEARLRPMDEFREVGEFEHDAHGFGQENPLSEEVFEQQSVFAERPVVPERHSKPVRKPDLSTPLAVETTDEAPRTDLIDWLREPTRAREAFVLKEILDAPRSRRPLR